MVVLAYKNRVFCNKQCCDLRVTVMYHVFMVTSEDVMAKGKKPNSKARLSKEYWSLYLDPPQAAALRALSKHTRVPAQVYLREGLDLILKQYQEMRK